MGILRVLFEEGAWWERGGQFLEGASVFRDRNFTSQPLFDLLCTCRLKDIVSLVIFHL